ncbi:GtrA family protein [Catellatospora sp. NPDC049609]|uniref:GtrA family protein n=1 Tax=Catellatospora sp. NPDC049609 TaxID=3155505 RepID=UPI00343D40FE
MTPTPPAPSPAAAAPLRLVERFRHLLTELSKFGVVGGAAYVVDLVVFNLLLSATGTLTAAVISTVVAATGAFVGNRFWTWRDRERSSLTREYLLYFFFNLVGLGITLAVVWLSHDVLGGVWPQIFQTRLADNVAKMLVGTGIASVFRFWAYRRFVFSGATVGEPARAQAG